MLGNMIMPTCLLPKNLRTRLFMILAIVLLAGTSGCQTGKFRAGRLPPELQAPPIRGAQRLDLGRLSRSSFRSDVVHPGDLLKVTVVTGLETEEPHSWNLRVAADGAANVPLVGPVPVAGLLLSEADQAIHRASIERGIYVNPQVSVELESRHVNRVTVMGAVNEPNVYEIPVAGSDVVAALAAAGGLTEEADTILEIRHPPAPINRGGVQQASFRDGQNAAPAGRSVTIDLAEAVRGAPSDLHVEDGSVVVVPKRAPRTIAVTGLVKTANQFELAPDQEVRLLDALAMANGRTLEVVDKVQIIRQNPSGGPPVVIAASVRQAKRNGRANIRLAPGDVVSVEETPLTFTIELIRSFVRFGFSGGIPGF